MNIRAWRTDSPVLLYAFTNILWVAFNGARLVQPRFKKAIRSFDAVYLFRSGSAAAGLIFRENRIRTFYGEGVVPDCEINFIDLQGALVHMLKKPNDSLSLLLTNKISQSGNSFYILKFGYLCGLIDRGICDLASRINLFAGPARAEGKS